MKLLPHICTFAALCSIGCGIRHSIKTFASRITSGYFDPIRIEIRLTPSNIRCYDIAYEKYGHMWYTNYTIPVSYFHTAELNETVEILTRRGNAILRQFGFYHNGVTVRLLSKEQLPRFQQRFRRTVSEKVISRDLARLVHRRLHDASFMSFVKRYPKYGTDEEIKRVFRDIYATSTYGVGEMIRELDLQHMFPQQL